MHLFNGDNMIIIIISLAHTTIHQQMNEHTPVSHSFFVHVYATLDLDIFGVCNIV